MDHKNIVQFKHVTNLILTQMIDMRSGGKDFLRDGAFEGWIANSIDKRKKEIKLEIH